MYIGPWQEYKLAQVLNFKQSLPQRQPKLNQSLLQKHNKDYSRQAYPIDRSASPSERSIYSEPLKEIETLYRTCRNVENMLARSEMGDSQGHKKPPIPMQRKRKAMSLQARRIEKLKEMYKLKDSTAGTQAATVATEAQATHESTETARLPVIDRRPPIPRPPPIKEASTTLPLIGSPKLPAKLQETDAHSLQPKPDKRTVMTKPPLPANKELSVVLPPLPSPTKPSKPQGSERFTSLQASSSPDYVLEEDFDRQADGLMRWIEELPDELSSSSVFHSKVAL